MIDPEHLIIVCCHAIWQGPKSSGRETDEWLIASFQIGETPTFINHIKAGLEALHKDSKAVLIFSGAATKRSQTSLTEAQSYLNYTEERLLTEYPQVDLGRIMTETWATDSYQNLLFSILSFMKRNTSHTPPERITLVSHEFKRRRFLELHRRAIKWPAHRIHFIGINPPETVTPTWVLDMGEEKDGWGAWKDDMYGTGSRLREKRLRRNFDQQEFIHYVKTDNSGEGVMGLLAWTGGDSGREIYSGRLPWNN